MPLTADPHTAPVVMLYNLDPQWTHREKTEINGHACLLSNQMTLAGHPTKPIALTDSNIPSVLYEYDPDKYIVFNWCESIPGIPHSEHLIARELESLGFVFTGAGSEALSLSQDKHRVKQILDQSGVPTPGWRIFHRADAGDWNQFPAIVKTANEHCSKGLTRASVVMNESELVRQIAHVLKVYQQPALVEDFIDGREFHVSIWGNGCLELLPPVEMDFSQFANVQDRLCTYDSKFVPGSMHYEGIKTLLPASLTHEELKQIDDVSKTAYNLCKCRDYARIDARLRDGIFYILDINPNADISCDASLACAAELAGYSYGETGARIVRLACQRHPHFCRFLH